MVGAGASELGAHVSFVASGPAEYSGMNMDNISMLGLAPARGGHADCRADGDRCHTAGARLRGLPLHDTQRRKWWLQRDAGR